MRLAFILIRGALRWGFYLSIVAALCIWFFARFFVTQAEERETQALEKIPLTSSRYVQAGDVQIHIRDSGTLKGEDVLIVPGFGGWTGVWQPTARALVDAGFRVITMDLPPFGYSHRPKFPFYDRQYQAERILGVLNALGIENVLLVAHSSGSGPAVEATLLAPKRVRGLVLVDALLDVAQERRARRYPPFLVDQVVSSVPLREAFVATFVTNPLFNEDILRGLVRDRSAINEDWLRLHRQPLQLKGTTRAIGEYLPDLVIWTRESRSENPDAYRKMKTPVHVIWGDSDPIAPYAQARQLVGMIPGAVLKTMHGVGHLPHVEDPQNFHQLLINSLNIINQDHHAARAAREAKGE